MPPAIPRSTALLLCAASCVPSGSGSDEDSEARAAPPAHRGRAAERQAVATSNRAKAGPKGFASVEPPAPPDLQAPLREVFRDRFARSELGPDWYVTSPVWKLKAGRLCAQGARNHPAWLTRRLPRDARIEFDATSLSADGDLKAEFWGDGRSAAQHASYGDATGYLAIYGGWRNRFHVLARLDEHAANRLEVAVNAGGTDFRARPVQPNRTYHFKVERSDGKTVQWLVDDIEIHVFADPDPLVGPGHDHFGFNNWEVPVCFDNLTITPLPED